MSDMSTTAAAEGHFTVRPTGGSVRLSTGEWLPPHSVRRVWIPAIPGEPQDADCFVRAAEWKRVSDYLKETYRTREEAVAYLKDHFNADDGRIGDGRPWLEEITLTLTEANEIISILSGEVMEQVRKYNFNFTVTYEVTGTVIAPDEEQAERAIERLTENMDDPGYSEPYLDGIDWDYIDVSHYETSSIGLEED